MARITRRTAVRTIAGAAGVSTFGLADWSFAQDVLKIGAVVPLTGPLNVSGQQYHFSLQLAQDDINAKGGIAGRKLQMVFEDTRDSNAVAVNAFVKLVKDLSPQFVFLSSYTPQNLATEPEVAKAAIPVMYSGGGDLVHERKNKWMFRIRPFDTIQALAMSKLLLNDMKAKKPGILYIQNDFGQGVARSLEKFIKQGGADVASVETYGVSDKDMSAQLLNIKNKGADAFVTISFGADGALILKQVKQLGINLPTIASSGVMVPAALNLLAADELTNLYGMIDAFIDPGRQDATGDYARRFAERFKVKADPYGSCYYDAAWILKDAIEKVGYDKQKLREQLTKVKDWKGVTQAYSTDENNNMVHSVAVVKFKPGTTEMTYVTTVAV